MIKTLRITSVVAVVLAVVFFVLPPAFGVRGDEQIEQFLNSAGAIEQFKEAKGGRVKDRRQEISPLVKQAEAFALYLNPPPKPKKIKAPVARREPRPKTVSAKFKLIGTSFYELHPELSLALIDEPGKGLRWVKQFSEVGHLTIEQVKDGLVVVRDGENTFELVADRPKKVSLVKEKPGERSLLNRKPEKRRILEKSLPAGVRTTESKRSQNDFEDEISPEERAIAEAEMKEALAELDVMLKELEKAQADVKGNEADLSPEDKEALRARQKFISELENMRISAGEAQRLDHLGRRLREDQREPNRVRGKGSAGETNLTKPGSNDVNIPK